MCLFLFLLHASKWDYKALARYIRNTIQTIDSERQNERMNAHQYKKRQGCTQMRREKAKQTDRYTGGETSPGRQTDVRFKGSLGSVKQDSLCTRLAHQTGVLLHVLLII